MSVRSNLNVLVVEDDPEISEVIAIAFEMRWPQAALTRISSGKEAVLLVESVRPDLVILDIGLPDIDGFEVLRELRLFSSVPVLILTARDEEKDIIKGLERGADDYIVKPFRQLELLARAQAVMRRYHTISESAPDRYGSIHFGSSIHTLVIGNRKINLTGTEGILISHFIRNAEKIIPVSSLAEVVWGADYPGSHEAVRVYIRRLRKKIEDDPEAPRYLHTHPGLGYSLKENSP
jgi:two-component system, OmpR family, response regulator VicR